MSDCHHEDFEAHVDVGRITESDGGPVTHFVVALRIVCLACRAPFGFRGMPVGVLPGQPTVSPDALEARMPLLSPAELELLGPLAAMQATPPGRLGFSIRRRR